ncbi:MAG TPA: hypothetical protein VKC54_02460 [Patescibacteria group bacterium]|nr:hypothetical protein [Patescibacteria group bacterium]
MTIESGSPGDRMRRALKGASRPTIEAIQSLREVLGENPQIPGIDAEFVQDGQFEDKNISESAQTEPENQETEIEDQLLESFEDNNEQGITHQNEGSNTDSVIGEIVGSVSKSYKEPISLSNKDHGLDQQTHAVLQKSRSALLSFIKQDPESQRLAQSVLQEQLESQYLKGLNATDRLRAQALGTQVQEVNRALTAISGKEVTLISLYNSQSQLNPEAYPSLSTVDGLFRLVDFHKELAVKIFSAAEIASESGELEAQKALVPLRTSLEIEKLNSRAEIAEALVEHGEVIKQAARLRGEVRAEEWKGWTQPIISTVTGIPLYVIKGPADLTEDWIDNSKDKGVPISAIIGGIVGTVIMLPSGPYAVIGTVAGATGGVASWTVLKLTGEKISDWGKQVKASAKDWLASRKK